MSLSRRMKKERGYFATKERYSEKTKTTLDTHHTCMGLNIIKLSKRSQIQRGTYCMIPFIYKFWLGKTSVWQRTQDSGCLWRGARGIDWDGAQETWAQETRRMLGAGAVFCIMMGTGPTNVCDCSISWSHVLSVFHFTVYNYALIKMAKKKHILLM